MNDMKQKDNTTMKLLNRELDEAREELAGKIEDIQKAADLIDSFRNSANHWCDMHTIAAKERDAALRELANLRMENNHNWQAVDYLEKLTELAHELRDALTGMEEYYRQHLIQGSLFLQVRAALTKAKEVLGEA